MMDKQELRQYLRRRRHALSMAEAQELSFHIQEAVKPFLRGTVALYESIDREVITAPLKPFCERYAVPVVREDDTLGFYHCDAHTVWKKGRFGIREPQDSVFCSPQELAVILVPLLGFDTRCYRIGYGRGYYDRFLRTTSALRIGLAYELQKVDRLPIEAHDEALDMIVTERQIYRR